MVAHERPARIQATPARLAAVSWLVAGLLFFALEAITAFAFRPPYSYARNFISDLGVAGGPQTLRGRAIDSPLNPVMNGNFIAHAILFVCAALVIVRATTPDAGRTPLLFLGLEGIHAAGSVLVGTFPASAPALAGGTVPLHALGAAMAILGGNAAILVAGMNARRIGATGGYCVASVLLGGAGLVSIAIGFLGGYPFAIPGVWERGGVYAILIWEIATGIAILVCERSRAFEGARGSRQEVAAR